MHEYRDYTVAVELTPLRPLAHGEGTAGNVQMFRRIKVPVFRDGSWTEEEIPEISGAAFKSALREEAALDVLDTCGIERPSKGLMRFLLKGGRLSKGGGSSVNLTAMRQVADLVPIMAVFGAMDNSFSRPGKIRVSSVQPWCSETVEAGLAPRYIQALTVTVDGDRIAGDGDCVEFYSRVEPIPLGLCTQVVDRWAHDMMSSPGARTLLEQHGHAKALEDGALALSEKRAGGSKTKSAEKVSEAMPYSSEVISPGTPLWATVVLQDATKLEWGCLLSALMIWISRGGYLGGGRREDWGRCRVRLAGAIEHSMPMGGISAPPGTALALDDEAAIKRASAFSAYRQHLMDRRMEIRDLLEKH